MSPEVLDRKLKLLHLYLKDLSDYINIDFKTYQNNHYAIERLFELLIITACDIIFHVLKVKGEPPPSSYSAGFLRAGELELLSSQLARDISKAAGLRNILVHMHEETDDATVYENIGNLHQTVTKFSDEIKNSY